MTKAARADQWEAEIDRLAPFELRSDAVVVVSAHPDDETLGAAGLMRSLHGEGANLELVIATDGEAAFASLGPAERAALGRRRRAEQAEAMRRLGLEDVAITWLGQPDSGLDRSDLRRALGPLLEGASLCLAPWPNDPHPDHRLAGLAARDVLPSNAELWCYPIWSWVWLTPDEAQLPWEYGRVHRLSEGARRIKRHAIDAFASQLETAPDGGEPIVGQAARRALDTDREVFFPLPGRHTTTSVARFERLYRDNPDPWGTSQAEYERRKREVTLAALPRRRYGQCLDAGAGTGELTIGLAARCDRVLAVDAVSAAVERCRKLTASVNNIAVEMRQLPDDWPEGTWDLLVFSELLYYFDSDDLAAAMTEAEATTVGGSHLLAIDWRPVTPDAPRDADDAHAQLLDRPGWRVLVEHVEEAFVLHVLERR